MKLLFSALLAAFIACTPAAAQWQTPNHSIPIGRGAGVTGFGAVPPGVAGTVLTSNGVSTDPSYQPSAGGGGGGSPSEPQGRLSPASGLAVPATSQAGVTTVNYVGYAGNNVPIYNGTLDAMYPICVNGTVGTCQLSVTLGSVWTANSNFDWYVTLSGGLPVLCTGPSWTSRTTQLTAFNGRNTNTATMNCQTSSSTSISVPANQATFLGSMRTGLAGQTNVIFGASSAGGTAGSIGLWNAFHRVSLKTTVNDTNVNITYTAASPIRPAMGSANNSVSFISGLAEDGFSCQYDNVIQIVAAAGSNFAMGCALDNTAAMDKKKIALASSAIFFPTTVKNTYLPITGWHTVTATENGDGTNANGSSGNANEAFTFEFEW